MTVWTRSQTFWCYGHHVHRKLVYKMLHQCSIDGKTGTLLISNVSLQGLWTDITMHLYARLLGEGIKGWCCLTSVCLFVWRLSVTYIGPKSKTERPRKTKIGTEVAYVTRDSDTTFKVKRPKVKVTEGGGHIMAASRTACIIYFSSNVRCPPKLLTNRERISTKPDWQPCTTPSGGHSDIRWLATRCVHSLTVESIHRKVWVIFYLSGNREIHMMMMMMMMEVRARVPKIPGTWLPVSVTVSASLQYHGTVRLG